MTIRAVGAELFRADQQTGRQAGGQAGRQAGMTKLIVTFRNFANTPKILQSNC